MPTNIFEGLPRSDSVYDGHINRNIRLAMALIDMTKPYIMVDRILRIKTEGIDLL